MKIKTLFFSLLTFVVAEEAKEEAAAVVPDTDFTDEQKTAMDQAGEKHEFQAEVSRLMDIIINSLYTERQVFLRELVSNSADAIEKARFLSVEDQNYLSKNPDLDVKVEFDSDAQTIAITDSGVGMTKADLINNLGTVAKSGTTNFLEAMAAGQTNANLIGQFGVGFYSAFLVADRITVISKHNDDDKQWVWESSADASFRISEDPRGVTIGRGTRVILHLKEDAHEFLAENKLKDILNKYSQFVNYPIFLKVKKEVQDEAAEEEEDDEDDLEVKDDEEEEGAKKVPEKKFIHEWEQINNQKPIWLRSREDIEESEYNEFYKSICRDSENPGGYTHFSAEGEIEFRSILYVPKKAPHDMLDNYWTKKTEVKLYVRRVLVADQFDDLLPRYLNFIRGVVDSDDLPLNVSREQLQQNKIMKLISKKMVRKVLELLKNLAKEEDGGKDDDEDEEKKESEEEKDEKKDEPKKTPFSDFFKEYSKNLKLGCQEDDANRSKLSKLLRFVSTKSNRDLISLDKYLDNMQENQDNIYYMSGESFDVMEKSPNLQIFEKKGLEVLLFDDTLDEGCIQRLADYEGKKFVSVQKADLKLDESGDEKKRFKKLETMYEPLTKWYKETLTDLTDKGALSKSGVKVGEVQLSKRLTTAPCTVVSSQFGYTAQQEKMMKAQAFGKNDAYMAGKKNLEINPNHPVIVDLLEKVKNDPDADATKKSAEMLFQVALVEQGYDLTDPSGLAERVYALMSKELGVDPDAPLTEVEVPDDDEEEEEEEKKEDDDDDAEEEEEKKEKNEEL
jgi:heat shock protein beta